MKSKANSFAYRVAVAIVLVLIASVVRTIVHHIWHEEIPYTPFYPAIIISTMIGGWVTGLFATCISGVAASFWLDPFGKPLIEELSDLVGMVLFLSVSLLVVWLCQRMLTAQKEAEVSAADRHGLLLREQEARVAAEAANRLKDEFVASVSHELRTPLQAILGWSEVLRLSNFDPVQAASALDTIQRSARQQSQLIEDMLDMSRIASGKMRLDVRLVQLAAVISAAIDATAPAARAKCLRIERRIDDSLTVLGDSDRLQQVLWNLLSNAIKFTPKGGSISISMSDSGGQALIEVADSGAGIAPAFLPFVFERFRQADSGISRRYSGLGLGLSIVKNLVELHGGSVSAFSEGPNRGATFSVSLPLADATVFSGGLPAESLECGTTRSLDGLRILFVDDDSDTCRLVKHVLEQSRAEVLTATSASEALAQIDAWNPDLLISDLGMPEQDGYALIDEVRQRAPHELPAVAFTAYSSDDDRRRSLASGYQLHLAKPIEPEAFARAIAQVARPKAK